MNTKLVDLKPEPDGLRRGMGLFPAVASNMLSMVGVGPFLTIPLMLAAMGGPQGLLGWILGALISICDGLVWAELGASMPESGGSYDYLRQSFGPQRAGKLMGFLFLWQVMLVGPLIAASGGVGFADYARYLFPTMTSIEHTALSMAVCVGSTVLLYRDIRSISKIAVVLWAGLILAMGVILWGGATHFSISRIVDVPKGSFQLSPQFFIGLGAATLISTYDFSGYFNVCLIGGEIEKPARNIPRTVLISIGVLACLYLCMSVSVISVVPWREAIQSQAIISDFTARLYGGQVAQLMTILILWIAFASVFCVLLGFTRVPFAGAVNGQFFRIFARVHPTRSFPMTSVLVMGGLSVIACLLSLDALIRALIVIQILTQFAAQCAGLLILRQVRSEIPRPFRMPTYPFPVIVAFAGWVFVLVCSGLPYIVAGVSVTCAGILAFLWRARRKHEWPFCSVT